MLDPKDFEELGKSIPYLNENLKISVFGRRLVKKIHFDWVREDEVIYFLGRKHAIIFWQAMILPALALFFIFGIFLLSSLAAAISPMILAGIFGVIIFLWALWRWEDWRNDYYIVTNQRVIWIEKIIGIHDSRQEAPLAEILSVGANVDFTGQIFNFGNVNIRTFVGNIHLNHVNHPYQVRHVIEELWKRAQRVERRIEKAELKAAMLDRLNNPDPIETKKKKEPEKKKIWREQLFPKKERNMLKLRFEQGKTIIYRKHWIILFRNAGIPGVVTAILLAFLTYQGIGIFFPQFSIPLLSLSLLTMLLVAVIPFSLWAIYQYIDWSNDTFQVTEDKIFDIDRTPLGNIQSRSAPLENIHSIKYERKGVMGYLFNYGTVYMEIGTADFAFEDVLNPGAVQQDLDNRRMASITKQKKSEQKKEQDRMIDWILAYHQSAADLPAFPNEDDEGEEGQIDDTDIYME